jgi:hypothetical protein
MRYLKRFKKLNEGYHPSVEDIFELLDSILRIMFFEDKPKKFFSIVFWNINDKIIYGELKLEYVNDENYNTLKQIWKIIEQNGKFKISPLTERRLGWYLKIPEEKLPKIFENLKGLTDNNIVLTNINNCVEMLKKIEFQKNINKYNL